MHVRALLVTGADGTLAEGSGRLDAHVEVLLAPPAPELYDYQRQRGRSVPEITAALTELAQAILGPRP